MGVGVAGKEERQQQHTHTEKKCVWQVASYGGDSSLNVAGTGYHDGRSWAAWLISLLPEFSGNVHRIHHTMYQKAQPDPRNNEYLLSFSLTLSLSLCL